MAAEHTNRTLEAFARRVTGDTDAVTNGVPAEALERYAVSLLDKRTTELRHAIPLTTRVAPWIPAVYRGWLGRHPARREDTVLPPGLAEAVRALPVLVDACDPPWTGDLLRFEVWRAATAQDRVERCMTSGWAIWVLAAQVAAGEVPVDPDSDPHELRFADRVYHRRCG